MAEHPRDGADDGADVGVDDEAGAGVDEDAPASGDAWPVERTETVFECPWFTVGYDVVERPNGERAEYYWVEPWDGVSVVARTDDGELVVVEEYRPRHRRTFTSFPKGGVEGESFVAAGKRELAEETGWRAGHAELVTTYRSAGWLRQTRGVVFATDLERGEPALEDGEYVEARTVPVEAALDLLAEEPVPAWTLIPLLAVERAGLL